MPSLASPRPRAVQVVSNPPEAQLGTRGLNAPPGAPGHSGSDDHFLREGYEAHPSLLGRQPPPPTAQSSSALPPAESGISQDIHDALCSALLESGASAAGVRGLKTGASFAHALRDKDGNPLFQAKPGGTTLIPVNDRAVQLDFCESEWGIVPAENELEEIVSGAQGRELGRVVAELNRANEAKHLPVRFVFENGELLKLQKIVSDLDLAYVLDAYGKPMPDEKVAVFAETLNRAYQTLGYPVRLVQHGAHFNGMMMPKINQLYGLTDRYQHDAVYTFVRDDKAARYQCSSPLLETFQRVYDQKHWPVGDATEQGVTSEDYARHLPNPAVGAAHPNRGSAQPAAQTAPSAPGQLALDLWWR